MQYWIRTESEESGPYRTQDLKNLARNCELRRTDRISADRKKWVLAGTVKGLRFPDDEDKVGQASSDADTSPSRTPASLASGTDQSGDAPAAARGPKSTPPPSSTSHSRDGQGDSPPDFEVGSSAALDKHKLEDDAGHTLASGVRDEIRACLAVGNKGRALGAIRSATGCDFSAAQERLEEFERAESKDRKDAVEAAHVRVACVNCYKVYRVKRPSRQGTLRVNCPGCKRANVAAIPAVQELEELDAFMGHLSTGSDRYYELQTGETGDPVNHSLEEVRDLLIEGRLTPETVVRWVDPKAKEIVDATGPWKTIGEGIAQEEEIIKALFNPLETYVRRVRDTMCVAICVPLFIVVVVLIGVVTWRMTADTAQSEQQMSNASRSNVASPGLADYFLVKIFEGLPEPVVHLIGVGLWTLFLGALAMLPVLLLAYVLECCLVTPLALVVTRSRLRSLPRIGADGPDQEPQPLKVLIQLVKEDIDSIVSFAREKLETLKAESSESQTTDDAESEKTD